MHIKLSSVSWEMQCIQYNLPLTRASRVGCFRSEGPKLQCVHKRLEEYPIEAQKKINT